MKARLIKEGSFGYKIKFYNDDDMAACALGLLSLKNCQAIERGYDLDELAEECSIDWNGEVMDGSCSIYKEGFQKALELMGDKKFSEEDVKRVFNKGAFYGSTGLGNTHYFDGILESLQQTEWDVEIEMEEISHYKGSRLIDEYRVNKLDSDGCLILKRLI